MSVVDPISDMLTRIRNAIMAGHSTVVVPSSKLKVAIAKILKEEGYIDDFDESEKSSNHRLELKINLKYVGKRRSRKTVISGLKRVSRPGRRVYVGKAKIPWVLSGLGVAIISTPKGVMTGDQARKQKVGGEVLCKIW